MKGRLRKLRNFLADRGFLWTSLYAARHFFIRIVQFLDKRLIRIEKARLLGGKESTITSLYHTREENRRIWDNYDWSRLGEEWTLDVRRFRGLDPEQWKASLINQMMLKYIKQGSTVLEIGPGGGRWTPALLQISSRLLLADISSKVLDICKERFKEYPNVEYYLIEDGRLDRLPRDSIDSVWTYDVFVHINPHDTEQYIRDLRNILKPGGIAIVHHPGTYPSDEDARKDFRSHVDGKFFAHLVQKYNMKLLEQDASLPHKPGDLISVFAK